MTFGILKIYYQITPFLDSAYTGAACVWKSFQGRWRALSKETGGYSALLWDGEGQSRVSGVSWRAKGGPCQQWGWVVVFTCYGRKEVAT